MTARPPLPPFTSETARQKVQAAEDGWNTRDPERVAAAYSADSVWRNRDVFLRGRAEIVAFLTAKWERELDYALRKALWAFAGNRIAVRFQYECHDVAGTWTRSYGNELWEFDDDGLMSRREASINDVVIAESDRRIFGPRSPERDEGELPLGLRADAPRAVREIAEPAAPSAVVRIEPHSGPRADLRPLFELAEDSRAELDSYLDSGRVLVAVQGGQVVGHIQVTDTEHADEAEIRNMAVLPSHRRRGVGRELITAAIRSAREESRRSVRVATAAADAGNLRFYQRLGFRMRSIERDAFTPATGYDAATLVDGIPLRDRVWLDLPLADG